MKGIYLKLHLIVELSMSRKAYNLQRNGKTQFGLASNAISGKHLDGDICEKKYKTSTGYLIYLYVKGFENVM